MFGRKPRHLRWSARLIIWLIQLPLRGLAKFRVARVTVINREVVPAAGSAIVAANHLGLLDAVYLAGALRRNVVAVAMAKLWRIPLLNVLLWWTGQIPVKRGDARSRSRAQAMAITVLKRCGLILIFPEGRCSKTGELADLKDFKEGVVRMARASGAPIIPVGLIGTNNVWPLGKKPWHIRPRRPVIVKFGAPLDPNDPRWLSDPEVTPEQQMLKALRDAIQELITPEPAES